MLSSTTQAALHPVFVLTEEFETRQSKEDADTLAGSLDEKRRIDYLPTPREIREACRAIRRGWTRAEQRRRYVGDWFSGEENYLWEPPVIDTSHFGVAARRVAGEA